MVIARDSETENYISTLDNSEIYKDMRTKYDVVTNEGDEYTDEHDKIVCEYASKKYNLTTEEVKEIYISSELKISEFHKLKLQRNK